MGRFRGQPNGPRPPHFLWNFVLFLNNCKKICLGPLADHCSRGGEQPPVLAIEHPVTSGFGLDLDQWKEKKNFVYNSATPWIKLNNLKKKTRNGISLSQSQKGPQMYKRGHGVMEATSLYIHTCMGSLFPNIHAMRLMMVGFLLLL